MAFNIFIIYKRISRCTYREIQKNKRLFLNKDSQEEIKKNPKTLEWNKIRGAEKTSGIWLPVFKLCWIILF